MILISSPQCNVDLLNFKFMLSSHVKFIHVSRLLTYYYRVVFFYIYHRKLYSIVCIVLSFFTVEKQQVHSTTFIVYFSPNIDAPFLFFTFVSCYNKLFSYKHFCSKINYTHIRRRFINDYFVIISIMQRHLKSIKIYYQVQRGQCTYL